MDTDLDPFSETAMTAEAPVTPVSPPPSEAQLRFLRSLAAERDFDLSEIEPALDRRSASVWIDQLKAMPKPVAARPDPPEGFHILGSDDTGWQVFKVQRAVHGSGRLYAKILAGPYAESTWEYVGTGILRELSEDTVLTLEKAQKYGQLYGVCCRCGATLTDESSIARGLGPVCAGRF